MSERGITLKVVEAKPNDVGRKLARLSEGLMRKLGLDNGDYVEIRGPKGITILQVKEGGDLSSKEIRIDGYSRSTVGVSVGDEVEVKKVDVQPANKVILAPIQAIRFDQSFVEYVKEYLQDKPLVRGETVAIPVYTEFLDLVVVNTTPSNAVKITDRTELEIREEPVKEKPETYTKVSWEDVGDLEEVKEKLREIVELPMKHPEIFSRLGIEPPKGVLLYGPPGVGKTLLARALASEIGAYFTSINGPEIMSKFYGESEQRLREIFKEAEDNSPAVIFIDEIDAIAPKREEVTGEVEKRVVAQLLTLMDGIKGRGKIVVIGATNRPDAVDPALRRPGRFDREIEIRPPDVRARKEILSVHTRNMPLAKDVNLDTLAEMTYGYTGADIAALAKEAALTALRRFISEKKINLEQGQIPAEVLKDLEVTNDDFINAMKVVRPTLLREVYVEVPNVRWDSIGGLNDVKQQLREAIEWPLKYPKVFENSGITPPKGILLFGPPGTGKTLLAKAVATEAAANFIAIRGPEIMSKWVGESEKAVRQVFERARQASPAIVFFDEIDSIAATRGYDTSSGVTERIVNQLLSEMDGIVPLNKVVVIAATNRPDIIDPALLRPGRFDRLVYVPPPDRSARLEILKVHTRKVPLDNSVNLETIAEKTEGYTGADLEALVREAVMTALREYDPAKINEKIGDGKEAFPLRVKMEHFEKAMKIVLPSLTKADIERYEKMARELKRAIA
ncbi:ATPase AAA [Sulfolobales archaeon HS-7]|nr:ATPase AAA [Sulfolobales archaeon HS-7]